MSFSLSGDGIIMDYLYDQEEGSHLNPPSVSAVIHEMVYDCYGDHQRALRHIIEEKALVEAQLPAMLAKLREISRDVPRIPPNPTNDPEIRRTRIMIRGQRLRIREQEVAVFKFEKLRDIYTCVIERLNFIIDNE